MVKMGGRVESIEGVLVLGVCVVEETVSVIDVGGYGNEENSVEVVLE